MRLDFDRNGVLDASDSSFLASVLIQDADFLPGFFLTGDTTDLGVHSIVTREPSVDYSISVGEQTCEGQTDSKGRLFHEGVPIGFFRLEAGGSVGVVDSFLGTREDSPRLVCIDAAAAAAEEDDDEGDLEPAEHGHTCGSE